VQAPPARGAVGRRRARRRCCAALPAPANVRQQTPCGRRITQTRASCVLPHADRLQDKLLCKRSELERSILMLNATTSEVGGAHA
jgi:hypothetical protein